MLLLLLLLLLVLCVPFHAQLGAIARATIALPKPTITRCTTPLHAFPLHYYCCWLVGLNLPPLLLLLPLCHTVAPTLLLLFFPPLLMVHLPPLWTRTTPHSPLLGCVNFTSTLYMLFSLHVLFFPPCVHPKPMLQCHCLIHKPPLGFHLLQESSALRT